MLASRAYLPFVSMRVRVNVRAILFFSCDSPYEACETCGYARKGGGGAQTPAEYSKAYGVFVKNLVVLRKSGVGYAQLTQGLSKINCIPEGGRKSRRRCRRRSTSTSTSIQQEHTKLRP
jgi:hypothetical protein